MKKILLLILSIALLSCSKSEDNNTPKESFKRVKSFTTTINFTRDLKDYEEIHLISYSGDYLRQDITLIDNFHLFWTNDPDRSPMENLVIVVAGEPTSVPGERSAIDFYTALTSKFDTKDKYDITINGCLVSIKPKKESVYINLAYNTDLPDGIVFVDNHEYKAREK